MKKLLLLITILSLSRLLSAQSLEFVNINPGTSLSGTNNVVFAPYAQVKNNSTNTITVKVKRIINTLSTGHISNFCFAGYCYVAATNVSAYSVDIAPGAVVDSVNVTLRADLNPIGNDGISDITYSAYDIFNESDSVCITFHYNAGPIGVNELFANSKFLSNAYPNPANKSSFVSYNLPTVINAQLIISNMLGSELKRFQLTEKTGSVELPVSTLHEGVYYYTLINDSKPLISKRLMVSHN